MKGKNKLKAETAKISRFHASGCLVSDLLCLAFIIILQPQTMTMSARCRRPSIGQQSVSGPCWLALCKECSTLGFVRLLLFPATAVGVAQQKYRVLVS